MTDGHENEAQSLCKNLQGRPICSPKNLDFSRLRNQRTQLYEATRLRGYLHCFRLVLGVQNLYEAVITSLNFHNPFEIGVMKRVRYLVEVLGVRYFAKVSGPCHRSSTFDDIVHRSRTESI